MKKPWYLRWWIDSIGFILLFSVSFIITFIFFVVQNPEKILDNTINEIKEENKIDPPMIKLIEGINNFSTGPENPKITIVEFSDYNCIVCKDFYPTIRDIGITYKEDVKVIYRDMPVITEDSIYLAQAARCSGEQDKFLEMHDRLFINQGEISMDDTINFANQMGLDNTKFANCLTSEKYRTSIEKDISDAQFLNLAGTPTIFINGHKAEGNIPKNKLEELINKIININ